MSAARQLRTLLLAGFLWGCATTPPEPAVSTTTPWIRSAEDRRLNALLEAHERVRLARSPEIQTLMGLEGNQDRWTPVSDARSAEDAALSRAQLAELTARIHPERLSGAGRLNFRLYRYKLETDQRSWRFRQGSYAFTRTFLDPYAQRPQFLIDRHRVRSVRDAENYIARLRGLPAILHDALEATASRRARGIVLPAFNFADITQTARQIASGRPCDTAVADNLLWADIRDKVASLDVAATEKQRLLDDATRALRDELCPAYRAFADRFVEWGRAVTRNDGLWAVPNGDALYREAIRLNTTLDLDPEAIHRLGLSEVARIEGEIRRHMRQASFDGSVAAFFDWISARPELTFPNTDAGRVRFESVATSYIERIRSRLPAYFAALPQSPVIVRPVPPRLETIVTSPFYTPMPRDLSGPGIYNINLSRLEDRPIWQLEALTYHEAIPGHHLQVAIATEMRGMPEFRRTFANCGFQEGWALYAEGLAREMGGYDDRYSEVGRLQSELVRAVRLVVDTGIHFKRWTQDQAAGYFAAHTGVSQALAHSNVERFTNWPGQALCYKLGELEIRRLRAEAEAALGPRFDLRNFHSLLLDEGVMPFAMIEQRIRDWMQGRSAAER